MKPSLQLRCRPRVKRLSRSSSREGPESAGEDPRAGHAPRLRARLICGHLTRAKEAAVLRLEGAPQRGTSAGRGTEQGWGIVEEEGQERQRMAPQKLPEHGSLSDCPRAVKSGPDLPSVSPGRDKTPAPSRHSLLTEYPRTRHRNQLSHRPSSWTSLSREGAPLELEGGRDRGETVAACAGWPMPLSASSG